MAKVPYVHSNYERIKDDNYHTIDKRCTYGFLEHFQPTGCCIDVCAPSGSGIVDTLLECGYAAKGISSAFQINLIAEWVVTNPPYTRGLVDEIITRQISRILWGDVYGVAVLLRSNFDFAKGRKEMFEHPNYFGQIKLRFRPWWSENREAQPIHNFIWHIWTAKIQHPPVTLYSDGICPSYSSGRLQEMETKNLGE